MENILVWTLVITTIAIVSMLVLLIASERDVKRKRLEIESLRDRLESAGPALEERSNLLVGEGTAVPSEITRLTEQVRANEVAIATMQCELEALRAENSWLKQETAAYQPKNPPHETLGTESIRTRQFEQLTARAAYFRLDAGRRRSRLIFPTAAGGLVLIALLSIFLARGRTTLSTERQAQFRDSAQINFATLRAVSAVDDPSDVKSEPEPKTPTPKKPARAIAGSSYEVVRSTRVFSEPNGNSRPLARIEAGTEVNVVDARDDWLEVRSRHGRPPGFIRKETAVQRAVR